MRSSVEPQTIASETAQKTNWKKNFASTVTLKMPMTGNAVERVAEVAQQEAGAADEAGQAARAPCRRRARSRRSTSMIAAIEKFVRIFATIVPAFFCREKPISRSMNPACMNITTMPATITHIVLRPTESGRSCSQRRRCC